MPNESSETNTVTVTKTGSDEPYECTIRDKHTVQVDERDRLPPVGTGQDEHPTPVDYLITSLASCQAAVLAQCLSKAHIDAFTIEVKAGVTESDVVAVAEEMPENTGIRLENIDVSLTLSILERHEERARRCLEVYDDGCIVGQSITAGIEYHPETTLTTSTD